jgi:hypothetical protein
MDREFQNMAIKYLSKNPQHGIKSVKQFSSNFSHGHGIYNQKLGTVFFAYTILVSFGYLPLFQRVFIFMPIKH